MAWKRPEAADAFVRASVTSASAATGFAFCGMVEEPPPEPAVVAERPEIGMAEGRAGDLAGEFCSERSG